MPVCIQCGQENPDIATFCLACGAPLADRNGLQIRHLGAHSEGHRS